MPDALFSTPGGLNRESPRPAWRTMDEDGEADSLSELSPCSLSCWMVQNLSHEQTVQNEKLSLSLPDTVLLQDGHLCHWLFTSSKSGSVVKRGTKRLEWDGFVKFLLRCSRALDPGAPAEVIATARRLREGRTHPVMLTARDIKSLREKHNAHLLDEIVAIQPFVVRNPFTGCGLFETEFERKGRKATSPATLATYELVRWPEEEVKWSDDFGSSCVESCTRPGRRAGDVHAQQRRRNGSAKRVHGVLHRLLATTTKQIVEHVERETGEVVVEVVAQFIFRPGSGQPTLLWLDSVHTARSTQQSGDHTAAQAEVADLFPDREFLQLTRDLGEGTSGRSWTTFFPPKIGDLVGGGESLGFAEAGLSAESQRSECFRNKTRRSASAEKAPGQQDKLAVDEGSTVVPAVPTVPANANEAADGVFAPASGMGEQGGDNGTTPGDEEEVANARDDHGADGGHQRGGHFTLPTESWAHRSAGRRGLYLSRTGGARAGADHSLNEQCLRKRSTGTTMRRDCHGGRLDLRSAAENLNQRPRPWTSPLTQASKVKVERGTDLPGSGCGPAGVDGCYGDYCHFAGTWSSHRTARKTGGTGIGIGGDPANESTSPAAVDEEDKDKPELEPSRGGAEEVSRSVSYRSILKSRAEEEALAAWSNSTLSSKLGIQSSLRKGGWRGEPQHLPTLTGSAEKDLRLLRQIKRKGGLNMAALLGERMRLLAASLSDRGGGQFFSLGSSNRATAGVPEAAQRAIEELIYEKGMSHLHPTAVSRSVAVCETCAMVYRYMDKYRRQTKQMKVASSKSIRAARIAVSRQRRQQQEEDRSRPHTADPDHSSPLRRYSDLNLGTALARATSDGLNR